MAETLKFRGGNTIDVNSNSTTVSTREIVIDTDTDQIVSGPSKKRTVMEQSNGDVEIGGGNISLNATGSAEFAGDVEAGDWDGANTTGSLVQAGGGFVAARNVTEANKNLKYLWQGRDGGPRTSTIAQDGSAFFAGITQSGTTNLSSTTSSGVNLNPSGQLVVQRTAGSGSNALLWRGYSGDTQTSLINSGGSAEFAGDVLIGGTLPSSPNINLDADGSAQFAGRVNSDNAFESDRTSGPNSVFVGKLNGTQNVHIHADGNAEFAGTARASTVRAAGSAGGVDSITAGTTDASKYFVVRGNGTVLGDDNGAASTSSYKYRINANGSAQFAGSVSIGGTAAANTIDSYEEGTFTPAVVGTATPGSPTYGTNGLAGKYVRIGQTCHIEIYIDITNLGGADGFYRINGLPFNANFTFFGNGFMRMFTTVQDVVCAAYGTHNTNFLFIKLADGLGNLPVQTGKVTVNASYTIL